MTSVEDAGYDTNNSQESVVQQNEEDETITAYIDIDDFNKNDLSEIETKYGASEPGFANESPLASQYVIVNEDYTLQATYFDTDMRVFGALRFRIY